MKKNKRKRGVLMRLFLTLVTIGAAVFLSLFAYVCIAEKSVPEADDFAPIIVLGAQVKEDGTPSVQLALRLETALSEYNKAPRPIVSCGGQGVNEPAPEGDVMTAWLIDHGVSAEHALSETTSESTKENLKNALSLLKEKTGKDVQSVLVVTSDYHLPRALAIARDLGLEASGAGAPIKPEYWLKNHVRETLAWGKYLLTKLIP